MSKAPGWPRGWQIPSPQAAQNLEMPVAVARGGWGGWAQLELTDALIFNDRFSNGFLARCSLSSYIL